MSTHLQSPKLTENIYICVHIQAHFSSLKKIYTSLMRTHCHEDDKLVDVHTCTHAPYNIGILQWGLLTKKHLSNEDTSLMRTHLQGLKLTKTMRTRMYIRMYRMYVPFPLRCTSLMRTHQGGLKLRKNAHVLAYISPLLTRDKPLNMRITL